MAAGVQFRDLYPIDPICPLVESVSIPCTVAGYSFDIKDHRDWLTKLAEELDDYSNGPPSSRTAINLAMTAYHMVEWVWEHEPLVNASGRYANLNAFREEVCNRCLPLVVMRDLANGSKHCVITRGTPKVDHAEYHEGSFDYTFDESFDTTMDLIHMTDGSIRGFYRDAKSAVEFWQTLFATNFHPLPGGSYPPLQ